VGFGYNDFQYFAAFYTLMLLPIPFIIFMREILSSGRNIFNVIIVLVILSFLISSVFLFCGAISSLIVPLPLFHVLIITTLVASVGIGWYDYVKYRKKHVLLILIGIFIYGIFAIFALIAFYSDNSIYSHLFRLGFLGFILFLCISTIRYAVVIVNNAAESNENKIKALKAENNLRVNQIGTHFFYHVMNTARVLIKNNPDAAYKMMGDISKYLRYKTDSSEVVGGIVKFSEEMKSIKAYVDMKQIILGDRLKVICEINTEDFFIPVLSIQPLVENAIKHGIEPKECGGTVQIIVNEDKDYYIIVVEDDGVGYDQENTLENNSISVSQSNIKERLSYYGDNEIIVHSIPNGGTKTTVKFVKGLGKTNENDIS
ncbi:MAG: histidine kinase, partial [Selenomonadaceae bacterium]